ncbi:hypothetical protein STEG23_014407 [Scotinomys teguina]
MPGGVLLSYLLEKETDSLYHYPVESDVFLKGERAFKCVVMTFCLDDLCIGKSGVIEVIQYHHVRIYM